MLSSKDMSLTPSINHHLTDAPLRQHHITPHMAAHSGPRSSSRRCLRFSLAPQCQGCSAVQCSAAARTHRIHVTNNDRRCRRRLHAHCGYKLCHYIRHGPGRRSASPDQRDTLGVESGSTTLPAGDGRIKQKCRLIQPDKIAHRCAPFQDSRPRAQQVLSRVKLPISSNRCDAAEAVHHASRWCCDGWWLACPGQSSATSTTKQTRHIPSICIPRYRLTDPVASLMPPRPIRPVEPDWLTTVILVPCLSRKAMKAFRREKQAGGRRGSRNGPCPRDFLGAEIGKVLRHHPVSLDEHL